jgi:hypothetical protein
LTRDEFRFDGTSHLGAVTVEQSSIVPYLAYNILQAQKLATMDDFDMGLVRRFGERKRARAVWRMIWYQQGDAPSLHPCTLRISIKITLWVTVSYLSLSLILVHSFNRTARRWHLQGEHLAAENVGDCTSFHVSHTNDKSERDGISVSKINGVFIRVRKVCFGMRSDMAFCCNMRWSLLQSWHLHILMNTSLDLTSSIPSADEWNLKKPLQQCSLRVERRGEILLVVFTFQKEGKPGSTLFALCKIELESSGLSMDHWVKPCGDSSRYFAVRVTDEAGGREAVIGLGFRERDEAADFVQCLTNYQNALARERLGKAQQMAHQ